jgi:hypothetical protein
MFKSSFFQVDYEPSLDAAKRELDSEEIGSIVRFIDGTRYIKVSNTEYYNILNKCDQIISDVQSILIEHMPYEPGELTKIKADLL